MNEGTSGAYGGPMKWPEYALSNFIKLAEISIDLLAIPKSNNRPKFRNSFSDVPLRRTKATPRSLVLRIKFIAIFAQSGDGR